MEKVNPYSSSYSVKVKCAAKPPLTPESKRPNPNWAALDSRMGGLSSSSSSRSYSPKSRSSSWEDWAIILVVSTATIGLSGMLVAIVLNCLGADLQYITSVYKRMGVSILVALALTAAYRWYCNYCEHITSVFKLQVGLLGMAKSLQRELERIAETADASTDDGLKYILTETTVALLRHPDYFISAYSSEYVKSNGKEGEKLFNELSVEERGKLDKETLVSVDDKRIKQPISRTTDGFNNEYIVVTILVVAKGRHKFHSIKGTHKFPTIKGSQDVKDALKMLGSILSSEIEAVEVTWTPQAENGTLSELEYLLDHPQLKPLK